MIKQAMSHGPDIDAPRDITRRREVAALGHRHQCEHRVVYRQRVHAIGVPRGGNREDNLKKERVPSIEPSR